MKISFLVTLISMISIEAMAESESLLASADSDFPFWTIFSQLANVIILVALLFFTQRKTIAQAFKDKKENFLKSVSEASATKKQAQDQLSEVQNRLSDLRNTYSQQLKDAEKNAEESYRTQLADAKNEAMRIKSASQSNLEFEVQRQIENLRLETFQKSRGLAEKNLGNKLSPERLKAWNNHFVARGTH